MIGIGYQVEDVINNKFMSITEIGCLGVIGTRGVYLCVTNGAHFLVDLGASNSDFWCKCELGLFTRGVDTTWE